jgi:serine/threonine protein kinase
MYVWSLYKRYFNLYYDRSRFHKQVKSFDIRVGQSNSLILTSIDNKFVFKQFEVSSATLGPNPNFLGELCSLYKLRGIDHVPPFYGSFIDGQHAYIVTKLYASGTIEAYITRRRSSAQFLHIFEKLCDVLISAKKKHISHRDIKPSNILMDGHDPILADWDSSVCFKHGDYQRCETKGYCHTNPICTIVWRSPEIFSSSVTGSLYCAYSLDIWSLACTMFYVVSYGHKLFPGITNESAIQQRDTWYRNGQPLPVCESELTKNTTFQYLIRTMMHRRPECRPSLCSIKRTIIQLRSGLSIVATENAIGNIPLIV